MQRSGASVSLGGSSRCSRAAEMRRLVRDRLAEVSRDILSAVDALVTLLEHEEETRTCR